MARLLKLANEVSEISGSRANQFRSFENEVQELIEAGASIRRGVDPIEALPPQEREQIARNVSDAPLESELDALTSARHLP